jgi:hypothetical protein
MYDDSDGILCRPGGPRHHSTPGPYCAPDRCYCPANLTATSRGPRTTVDGEPIFLRDPAAGQQLRADGEQRALTAASTWRDRALASLRALAASGDPFTSEHVVERVGLPTKTVTSNANNAVGALISMASKRGLIEPTGRLVPSQRPSSHGATLREWRGTERGRVSGQ